MTDCARVYRLDDYRPLWRTAAACCAKCRARWRAVLHVEVRLGEVRCPACGRAGSVTLLGLSGPQRMPQGACRTRSGVLVQKQRGDDG